MENVQTKGVYASALDQLLQQNLNKPVKAILPQDSKNSINIRIVGASISPSKHDLVRRCQPRTSTDGKVNPFVNLPTSITQSFDFANQKLTEWLAKSPENASAFLTDPVLALKKAGIELQRSDDKRLARTLEEMHSSNLLSPGMRLEKFSASFKAGKVMRVAPEKKSK